jgi:hypothetical protein
MARKGLKGILGPALAALAVVASQTIVAEQTTPSLGSVKLNSKVMADGQPLAAGTYTLRVSAEAVKPVVGQTAESAKWVEFVQGGAVKGRELATVASSAEVQQIAEGKPPASGSYKIELLKGNEYIRVWVNRGGTHYLIHLTKAAS